MKYLVLNTKNLIIVPVSLEYAEDIFREFTPEITVYMYPRPYRNIEETRQSIRYFMTMHEKGSRLQMVVLARADNSFLGCAGLYAVDTPTPEFGIWIKRSAQGKTYGKETIHALKTWADENIRYEHLLYPVTVDNLPSRKIAESMGGIIAREYDDPDANGIIQHCLEYRIYPAE